MPEDTKNAYRYRVLRYTPDVLRDEWVNIGVLLEDAGESGAAGARQALRVIEDAAEIARVRRLHPAADEELLRQLPVEFEMRLADSAAGARAYLEKLGDTLSNVLQLSPQRAVLAEDFDAELDRLYRDHVAPPVRSRGGVVESTRAWIRARLNDVFRRHRILSNSSAASASSPSPNPATRCGWTTPTRTACAGICIRWRSTATPRNRKCSPTPPNACAPACRKANSRPSRKPSLRRAIRATNSSCASSPNRISASCRSTAWKCSPRNCA